MITEEQLSKMRRELESAIKDLELTGDALLLMNWSIINGYLLLDEVEKLQKKLSKTIEHLNLVIDLAT